MTCSGLGSMREMIPLDCESKILFCQDSSELICQLSNRIYEAQLQALPVLVPSSFQMAQKKLHR